MSDQVSEALEPLSGSMVLDGLPMQLQFWLLRLSAYALLNLADDAALRVNLIYALRSTGDQRSEAFTLPSASGTTGGTGATP